MAALLILSLIFLVTSIVFALSATKARAANASLQQQAQASQSERDKLRSRLKPVLYLEAEASAIAARNANNQKEAEAALAATRIESETLRGKYQQAHQRYELLQKEVTKLEETLEVQDLGLYKPHFTYEDSEAYKVAISAVREQQKILIKAGQAVTCAKTWFIEGDAKAGERMVKQNQKLILRSINAESEAAIANVSWNNYDTMRARIEKAFEMANKLGTVLSISASDQYLHQRLEELRLVHEAAEKRQQEKETQRRLRAEQREEEKVQRELEREKEDADRDARKAQRELEESTKLAENAMGEERTRLLDRILILEQQLESAKERGERAVAQAQLTKVGHVYIISNHGSFGERLFKIGMTRRLEPRERIQELGDASVPFPFDLHALIYSENAPELEAKLHNCLWNQRINWANDRKEFFEATLDDIRKALQECTVQADLNDIVEAKEFHLSRSSREAWQRSLSATTSPTPPQIPRNPFVD